MKNYKKFLFV